MNSIAYVVPYFGKMRSDFELWLMSCKWNEDIDWLIFTDDYNNYNFPKNVIVRYINFQEMKKRIQENYNFIICLNTPYKICDYRVAYGEIFHEELKKYDFWGYCDFDMLWGNIRQFYTTDLLNKFDRIGFQGHSTIYRNNDYINKFYRKMINGKFIYKEIFQKEKNCFFDELAINDIYKTYNVSYYTGVDFANLNPNYWAFRLTHLTSEEKEKYKRIIFIWEKGHLYKIYSYNKSVYKEECMYVHFLRRRMNISNCNLNKQLIIFPNSIVNLDEYKNIDCKYVLKHSRNNMFIYWLKLIIDKRKKITWKNVYKYFKFRIKQKQLDL